jgi:hypothetical protein
MAHRNRVKTGKQRVIEFCDLVLPLLRGAQFSSTNIRIRTFTNDSAADITKAQNNKGVPYFSQ